MFGVTIMLNAYWQAQLGKRKFVNYNVVFVGEPQQVFYVGCLFSYWTWKNIRENVHQVGSTNQAIFVITQLVISTHVDVSDITGGLHRD